MLLVLACRACQPCSTRFTLHMPVYCTWLPLCLPFNWCVLLYVPCTCRIASVVDLHSPHDLHHVVPSSLSASQFGAASFKASSIIYSRLPHNTSQWDCQKFMHQVVYAQGFCHTYVTSV